MLNPNGPSCAAIDKSKVSTTGIFNYGAEGQLVYCDGDDSSSCQNATLNECTRSDLYPNCFRRIVSGEQAFGDPESIVTPPIPVDFALNSTYYLIYYESQGARGCFGTSVAIEGGVIGDRKTFQTADTGLCSAETTCLIDPISPQCVNATGGTLNTADIQITYTARGSLQLCDTSNVEVGEDLCLLDPPQCDASSLYPSCTYILVTGEELVASPAILENESPPATAGETVYNIFYTDPDCTQFGAMRGMMMDTPNEFLGVEDLELYTCQDVLICLLNPGGEACGRIQTTSTTRSYFRRGGGDSSNIILNCSGAPGNETCAQAEFETCQASALYPGCYFSTVMGTDLLKRPVFYVTPPTSAPSSSPTTAPTTADEVSAAVSWHWKCWACYAAASFLGAVLLLS